MNVVSGMGGGGYGNPLGRASVTGPIAPPGALLCISHVSLAVVCMQTAPHSRPVAAWPEVRPV